MFFPKCPLCNSRCVSDEDDSLSYGNRQLGRFASGGMTGHAHPLLGLVSTAISMGDFVYRRFPGGGAKRCTNPSCRHQFN